MLNKKKITKAWFKGLQDLICDTVLELEKKMDQKQNSKLINGKKVNIE